MPSAPAVLPRARARLPRRTLTALLAVCTAAALTGCGPGAVVVEPAVDAANADCASAMLAMPGEISDQAQRETTSQATTAYGDPASLIVRCGVTPPEPTTDMCSRVNGVDWIIRETDQENRWKATTYGREPAFEVTFDTTVVASSTALIDLSSAVETVDQDRECLSVDETLEDAG
ncbi:DUF3515 family protein [Kocuria sp. JC486]|uniref:DUF3515 family protein n=1 Tax=Kocuria sp. JC486 TaxID=1970736 RepID=UPI0014204467|nr:DUF3515 family protein [Kocuria sp. JC486]NHU84606.1 DUF3515 family protein [Kocuria sp. JC486]